MPCFAALVLLVNSPGRLPVSSCTLVTCSPHTASSTAKVNPGTSASLSSDGCTPYIATREHFTAGTSYEGSLLSTMH